jgi:hypothetical protein
VFYPAQLLQSLVDLLLSLEEHELMQLLVEIVATQGNLRIAVSPKYVFEERLHDLTQCLRLDGYILEGKKILPADPSIGDAAPMEDDLMASLKMSKLPGAGEIERLISASAEAFRALPPNYNASLSNARVALETLACSIAGAILAQKPEIGTYDPSKWGTIIAFLRAAEEITVEEEKGLAGVYGFLSPGAHRPVGISEDQMARLGRSFALNMCWFLVKNHFRPRAQQFAR